MSQLKQASVLTREVKISKNTCLEHNNEKTARIIKVYFYPTGLRAGSLPDQLMKGQGGKLKRGSHNDTSP